MTTKQIARKLVAYCKEGKYQECYKELYSPNIKSIEPDGHLAEGFEEIAEKGKEWNAAIKKFHGSTVGRPSVAGNYFTVPMTMDITYHGMKEPVHFEEICLYTVADGKIVREQFFYDEPVDM